MARRLDWVDIWLHVAGAVVAVAVVGLLFAWYELALVVAATINSMMWPLRETWQDVRKGHNPPWPWRYSLQKHLEAWPPVFAGWLTVIAIILSTR